MNTFDIAIIGGGMVGLSLALALKPSMEAGKSLVVIDPAAQPDEQPPQSPSFDDRATALANFSCQIFEHLEIWPLLSPHASLIDWIEVSDRGHLGYQALDSQRLFNRPFGAVVSNANLGQALWQKARALPQVEWCFGESVDRIDSHVEHQRLHLNSTRTVCARHVFLCDGGRSGLLHRLGIPTQEKPYEALARIATVRTEQPHKGRAYERFTHQGPIALLPFGDFSALVWTYPERLEKRLNAMNTTQQLDWLNQYFGQRLGRITEMSQTRSYPLSLVQAVAPIRHRLMALGNSAATLHPVAGQGFNLAMRSLMRSAQYCNQCFAEGKEPGEFKGLQELAQDIAADQRQTAFFSDQLVRLFSSTSPMVAVARTLALGSLDRHPLAQKAFALASMGLLQDAPLSSTPLEALPT